MRHKPLFKELEKEIEKETGRGIHGTHKLDPQLKSIDRKLKRTSSLTGTSRSFSRSFKTSGYMVAFILALVVLATFVSRSGMTGWIAGGDELITYVQSINTNVTENTTMTWVLDAHPESFNLRYLKLSGQLKGEGNASVHIQAGGRMYLIMDQDTIRPAGLASITGHAINIPEGVRLAETEEDRKITTRVKYNPGTIWDSDDNGVAYTEDGVVDLTVADSEFNWHPDESRLCTKWEITNSEGSTTTACNGAADCCALAGVAPEEKGWNVPLYVFHGKYGATDTNTVTAQVIFLNQSIGNETYLESVVGQPDSITASFVPKPTTPFKLACEDTCTLTDGFNSTTYTLHFELDEGMEIYIENLTYALENLTEEAGETGELNETVNPAANDTVEITPEIKDAEGNTLAATVEFKDKENRRAALKRTAARPAADSTGGRTIGGMAIERRIRGAISQGDGSTDEKVNLTKGSYKVEIDFEEEDLPVRRILIEDANVSGNSTGFLKLDDVEEEGELAGFEEVYAIDPTEMNFTNATVTAQAKGGWLYKCRDWDFENQECPELRRECTGNTKETRNCTLYGGWQRVQKLQPGQEYSFTLTPADPGYAEYNSTYGAPYCEDGTSPCIADSSDLKCRDSVSDGNGPEPNQPNTIDSCPDGTTTYSSPSCGGDESVENITITDLDSSTFSPGDTVQVEAWVHCYSASDDKVAVVYTSDASSPSWTVKEYKACSQADSSGSYHKETFTAFDLDNTAGDHAVRVYVQYDGESGETCADSSGGTGTYDDNDDVVFTVGTPNTASPSIDSISDTPDPVTAGENITIRANVSGSDIESVWTGIAGINYTMNPESSTTETDNRATGCFDSEYAGGEDWEAYAKFTISGSGTANLTKLWWYQPDSSFTSGEKLEMALYNPDRSMITESRVNISGTGAQGWTSGTIPGGVEITLGQTFWIGYAPVSGTFDLPVDSNADCGSWLPNEGSYGYSPSSGGLNDPAYNSGQVAHRYFNPGVTYEQTSDEGYVYTHNTSGMSGEVPYTVYANNSDSHENSSSGSFTVNAPNSTTTLPHYAGFEADKDGWTFSDAPAANPDSNRSDAGSNRQDDGSAGGSWSAHLQDNSADSYFSQAFDFSENTSYMIAFYYYPNSIDSGEFTSMYCDDTEIWRFTNGDHAQDSWYPAEIYLTSDNCTLDSDMTIKWNGSGLTGNVDNLWVDGINITAYIPVNNPPTHSTPLLSSSLGTNLTSENLTCYNQSTDDEDSDSVKNIFDWKVDGTSIAVLNMPIEATGGNETSWTRDYSGNGLHGTATGASWSQTGGHDGFGAYELDGSTAYIDLGEPAALDFTGNNTFTLSAWVKVDGGAGNHRPIINKGDTQYTLKIFTNNTFEACAYDGGWQCTYSQSALTEGVWYHVAGVFGEGNVTLYVDGTHQETVTHSGITDTANDVQIGHDSQNTDRYLNGSIDQVMIYNRALTSSQVQALHQGRTDLIFSDETSAGDVWQACVTPNDGTEDGTEKCANTLTVLEDIDETAPASVTALSESSTGKTWIKWGWTNPGDTDFDSAILYLNGTNVANTSSDSHNFTGLSGFTTYSLTVHTKDATGNVNTSDVTDNAMTQDNIAPQYSGIVDANGTAYSSGGSYQFNITWTDNVAVNDVTFSFDGTNYTNPTKTGDEYYISMSDLAAGSYSYTWYAEDFLENEADTGTRTFVLAKADSTIDLLLNGSDDNLTEAYPIDINITADTTTGDDVEVSIYRNGTQISSGTPPLTNVSTYSTAATYNITATYAESQNYTASSDTHWLTIEDQTPPSGVTNLGESGAGTDWIRWIWTEPDDGDFDSAILYLNGTNIANTSSNYYNISGLSGYTSYQLTVHTKDTSGNLNTTDVWDNAMTLDNIAPQYTGMNDQNNSGYAPDGSYQFNITWTDNVAVNDVTFSFDGTNYTNPTKTGDEYYISMSDIAAGSHTYRWHAEDFLSNMNSTAETEFIVVKATPSLMLSSVGGWSKEYGLTSNVNCSTTSPGVSAALYRNGTEVSNPDVQTHGASTYEYTCNTTETQNYTAGSAENNLTITKASSSVNLLLNGTDSNLTIERLSDANLTGEKVTGDDVAIILYVNSTGSGTGASPVSNISTYSEQADYNITLAYPGSQNYTASSETHWLKVRDTTPPGSVSGPAEQSRGSSWITWNWTEPADADYAEAIVYVNGTNVANVSGNSYNATGLTTYTVYGITTHTKDVYGNVNDTGVSDTARTLDEISPSYSGIYDQNGTAYSQGGNYQFNITWTDNVEVGSVTFSFDGTNYTSPSQSGDEYYVTLTDLAAGSYSYTWYATDSAGNQNETGAQNFEIVKASTTMNISILPGWNETYGTETTVTCSADNDEVTATLWRDGAQVSIPDTQTPGGGNHTYVCNASSTTNYTAGTASDELTINRAEPDISLLLNGTESNITIEVGGAVNETGLHDHPCTLSLYEAGSLITSGSSPVTQITEYNTLGTYNVTLQHPLTQNHTAAQETLWITVQDTTEPEVTPISPEDGHATASQTHEFMFNFTDNHYSTADCTLYVNGNESGSNISAAAGSTISITNSTLPEGQDEWHINCTDGSGNTGQSGTRNITIDITPPVITPVRPVDNETIGYILLFKVDVQDAGVGIDSLYVSSQNSSGDIVFAGVIPAPYQMLINTSVYPDGRYNITGWANDTLGNTAERSIIHYINNTMPFIQIQVPTEGSKWNNDFNLNIEVQDDSLHTVTHNITYPDGTLMDEESHEVINVTDHHDTENVNTSGTPDGNYSLNIWANDTVGYEVTATRHFIIDKTAPQNIVTGEPTDPSTYSAGASYTFNSTWNDTYGMETVKLEFDGVNYTASNGGSTYTNTLSGLAAGTYTYRWHGQDEAGNRNSTEEETFTVLQASSSCTLSFDKSSPQTYGTSITAECACTNPETDGLLWRDGTDVTGSEDGSAVSLAAGSYDYACNSSETQNYTSATDSGVFVIDKAATMMNISILPSWNETYGTETTVTCSADNDEVTATLWRDGVQVSIPDVQTLGGGEYDYVCNASSTTNHTDGTASDTLNIDRAASSVSLLINGSASDQTIERTAAANLTASRVTGTGPVQLLRNGTLLDSGDAVSDVSTYDIQTLYNITAHHPETQNHSASQQTLWLTVNDTVAPGAVTNLLMLNRGQNYIYWVWTNPDDEDLDHVDVYVNDSHMTSTSSEYHYATGLDHSSYYTLSVRTVDTSGGYGEWVNDTQRTAYNCTEDWQAQYGECNLNDTKLKWYEDAANCGIYYNLPADNGTRTGCDCVVSTEYDGNTTNLTGNDLTSISGVVLEVDGLGKIEFRQEVNITRCIDLDTYAGIGRTYARIDSEDIPELNRSAQITLYNITYNNPIITVNGSQCPASRCAEINHTNSTYIFNVTHFTRYTVEEGPYCGDGSCDTGSGERCSNCPADCGSCGTTGGGGGGGGGGGSSREEPPCEPNWLCYSWGPCVDFEQTRTCFDANGCGNESDKPPTHRECIIGCAERWACQEWGPCTESGVQTRTCMDNAKCGSERSKPLTVQPCEYDFCHDGKMNGNEEGIDCGGRCRPCTKEEIKQSRRNMLTGEAITVQPYEPPNPLYIMPLLLMLVLLVAVIALQKVRLSDRVKKLITAAHVLLVFAILLLMLLTFNVPEITGNAIAGISEKTGIPGILITVLVSALLIGTFTYVTINRGKFTFKGMDDYIKKSKYWTAYAAQKTGWKPKRAKKGYEQEIEVDIRTPETRKERASGDTDRQMFGEVMKAIDKLNIKMDRIEDEVEEIENIEKKELGQKKAKQKQTETPLQPMTIKTPEKAKTMPAETLSEEIKDVNKSLAKITSEMNSKTRKLQTRKLQTIKPRIIKPLTIKPQTRKPQTRKPGAIPARKEAGTPAGPPPQTEKPAKKVSTTRTPARPTRLESIKSSIGKEDPLKIAERIIGSNSKADRKGKKRPVKRKSTENEINRK